MRPATLSNDADGSVVDGRSLWLVGCLISYMSACFCDEWGWLLGNLINLKGNLIVYTHNWRFDSAFE